MAKKKESFLQRFYKQFLLIVFLVVWVWSMWNPASQENWFLENKAVFVSMPIIYFLFVWYIKFSKLSLTLVTVFLILHVIGAHYNYGSVPIGKTLGALLAGEGTNIYDKIVHFSFGLLVVYPLREFFLRVAQLRGFWGYLVPYMAILTLASYYEIFEWVTVMQYDTNVGYLFIGGSDPFDTTKDLFVAAVGALITLVTVAILEWAQSNSTFKKKMKQSFKRDTLTYPVEDTHLHEKLESIN